MSTLRDQLLADIETYLVETGMRETAFGRDAMGDTAFVSRLRHGRDPKGATVDKAREWMRSRPPRKRGKRVAGPKQFAAAG